MPGKARKASDHPEFGAFLVREIKQLNINREEFRQACHMWQNNLEAIKKGSTILK